MFAAFLEANLPASKQALPRPEKSILGWADTGVLRALQSADLMHQARPAPLPPYIGRIQKADPPQGSRTYIMGVLESRNVGSTFWILPGGFGLSEALVSSVSGWVGYPIIFQSRSGAF